MKRRELLAALRALHACDEAMRWILPRTRATPKALWESCPDDLWMLWLLDMIKHPRREAAWDATCHVVNNTPLRGRAARDRACAVEVASTVPWARVVKPLRRAAKIAKRRAIARGDV